MGVAGFYQRSDLRFVRDLHSNFYNDLLFTIPTKKAYESVFKFTFSSFVIFCILIFNFCVCSLTYINNSCSNFSEMVFFL